MKQNAIERSELKKLYIDQGLTQKECAKRLGVGPKTVSRYCKKYGFSSHSTGRKTSLSETHPELLEKLKVLYVDKKLSISECARQIGIAKSTAENYVTELGLEELKHGKKMENQTWKKATCSKKSICPKYGPECVKKLEKEGNNSPLGALHIGRDNSLCWCCRKSTNRGCSWSASFIPVTGWKVKKTEQKYHGEATVSYNVLDCPEFEFD